MRPENLVTRENRNKTPMPRAPSSRRRVVATFIFKVRTTSKREALTTSFVILLKFEAATKSKRNKNYIFLSCIFVLLFGRPIVFFFLSTPVQSRLYSPGKKVGPHGRDLLSQRVCPRSGIFGKKSINSRGGLETPKPVPNDGAEAGSQTKSHR